MPETYEKVRSSIKATIIEHGQYLVCVGKSADEPDEFLPFVYTIGNYEAGLPELLLIFACDNICCRIINILGEMQRTRNMGFMHGEIVDFTAALPAKIIDAGDKGRNEYAFGVKKYYNQKSFELRQILLPDQNGKYPGESGCLPPYSLQPLLSPTN